MPLIVVCGPPAGPQTAAAHTLTGVLTEPPVVLRYDANPWANVIDQVPLVAVAALAQRLANPGAPGNDLRVPNLEALRDGSPFLRGISAKDFTPPILQLALGVARGGSAPRCLIIDSLSRLYEQALTQTVAAAVQGLGNAEKAYPVAQLHDGDAIARICWDLNEAATLTIATAWDTDTMRSGKVSGSAPMLPKSALNQTWLVLRATSAETLTVERSTRPGTASGTTLTTETARDWMMA